MSKRIFALVAVAAALVIAAPAAADWLHFGDSIFQTTKNSERHPVRLARMLVVPTDLPEARICMNYASDLASGSRGTVTGEFEIERDPQAAGARAAAIERVRLSASVRNNSLARCRQIAALSEGDLVYANLTFRGFPKLRKVNGTGNWVSAFVSVGAELDLPEPTVEPEPVPTPIPTPDPDPDPDPDPGNDPPPITPGELSAEDQAAVVSVAALAGGGAGVQVRLQTGSLHFIDYRDASGAIFEFGPASTIAGAAASACAFLPCGPGGGLSSLDQTAIAGTQIWINLGERRLGIRFESDGVYWDWQPPLAGNHTGPFGSIWDAYVNFCNIVGDCV